nr:hypothetical protein [Tanacetum cinerariifolium]
MPNVDVPQGIDTGGSPRRQETMRGTSAQSRSKRVLGQPNEPPLTEGNTSGSGEDRLEENIKLMDTVPTPHDSPLTGGYTPGCDKGRITLADLMETYTTLSKKESQLKQKRSSAVIHSSDEEGPMNNEKFETAKHSRDDDDDETLAETFLNIKMSSVKDKRKGIIQEIELPKKLKKKEMIQLSRDEELA